MKLVPLLTKLFQYSSDTLLSEIAEGKALDQVQQISFFAGPFKTINKWSANWNKRILGEEVDVVDFQSLFFDAYELIYYRYFNLSLEQFLQKIAKKAGAGLTSSVINWVINFWFTVTVLSWWWYQLTHYIDFDQPITQSAVERATLQALRSVLNNALVTLDLKADFKDNHYLVQKAEQIKALVGQTNTIYDFTKVWEVVQPLAPTNLVQNILNPAKQEEALFDAVIYFSIMKFDPIIKLLIAAQDTV